MQKFPTWGLECTCSCFVPGLSCSYLCSHASPPGSSLWNRERCFLPPLLRLFRQPRGKAFPLATAVYAAVKVFLWFLQFFSAAPSFAVRNWALLWVCLQLQEICMRNGQSQHLQYLLISWISGGEENKHIYLFVPRAMVTPLLKSYYPDPRG